MTYSIYVVRRSTPFPSRASLTKLMWPRATLLLFDIGIDGPTFIGLFFTAKCDVHQHHFSSESMETGNITPDRACLDLTT